MVQVINAQIHPACKNRQANMPEIRSLKSPPITEAIIDVRVIARHNFDINKFAALEKQLASIYPVIEQKRAGQVTLEISATGPKPPTVKNFGIQGFFYKSVDEKKIVQFRIDGFTFNQLKPYIGWDNLFPLAMEMYDLYLKIAQPKAVTRLAVRYINHIPLPNYPVDFDDYLTAGPQIPSNLPQTISSFLSRVTIFDEKKKISSHVVQSLQADNKAKRLSLLLDIDTFMEISIDPHDQSIRDKFSQMQTFKNSIFFNYLTEKAIQLFE